MSKMRFKGSGFGVVPGERKQRRRAEKQARLQVKEELKALHTVAGYDEDEGFPRRAWAKGGNRRRKSGWGVTGMKVTGLKTGAHTAATAFPYVSGPNLGSSGVLIGEDLHGGGPFAFDPWVLYDKGIISGMSMVLFGTVGMGKSSLAKALAIRLVLVGRKLSVASDLKGEWTEIVRTLKGHVIQIGPGLGTKLNPLDPGMRPSTNIDGAPMSDDEWHMVVRTRRLALMTTVVQILTGQDELTAAEHAALEEGVDGAVNIAYAQDRAPTIPDVITVLKQHGDSAEQQVAAASRNLALCFRRMVSGDLAGMFDGESTVSFAADVPATSIDTSAMRGASKVARRLVSACCGAWMESMVTNSDGGQRFVIYEEGWDSMSSRMDLQRMLDSWKLARYYGIFNLLIMHKVSDLKMAGDEGSAMSEIANGLLTEADVKVIYRQDSAALGVTTEKLELNEREKALLKRLPKGEGLWRVGQTSFEVANTLTAAEIPLLDTDQRMDVTRDEDEEEVERDEDGEPISEWLAE